MDDYFIAWTDIGHLDDIPRQGARVVITRTTDIAVFRTADDQVFALHDKCPHKAGKLSQGIVHGTSVTCPLHNWIVGLTDGQARDPDEGCTRTVPVRLRDGRILLGIGAPLGAGINDRSCRPGFEENLRDARFPAE